MKYVGGNNNNINYYYYYNYNNKIFNRSCENSHYEAVNVISANPFGMTCFITICWLAWQWFMLPLLSHPPPPKKNRQI